MNHRGLFLGDELVDEEVGRGPWGQVVLQDKMLQLCTLQLNSRIAVEHLLDNESASESSTFNGQFYKNYNAIDRLSIVPMVFYDVVVTTL